MCNQARSRLLEILKVAAIITERACETDSGSKSNVLSLMTLHAKRLLGLLLCLVAALLEVYLCLTCTHSNLSKLTYCAGRRAALRKSI